MMQTIGNSSIEITPVAMGCWPIAGMTSIDVNDEDSLRTLQEAYQCGINFFDTAYCYGANGQSEKLICRALSRYRDQIAIATKCGIHWNEQGVRQINGRPEKIKQEFSESLQRLQTGVVELLYHHAPDPDVPVVESAAAFREILDSGRAKTIGVSNYSVSQMNEFATVCPISAVQPHYNMLQREIEGELLPWVQTRGISVMCYWPLMKGLLAGHLPRDHQFDPRDGRRKYPMFQGEEWQKNQDFMDELRAIALDIEKTVSQIVINWTIHRPGITSALCGAKRPAQIKESAGGMGWKLDAQQLQSIDAAIRSRGPIVSASAV